MPECILFSTQSTIGKAKKSRKNWTSDDFARITASLPRLPSETLAGQFGVTARAFRSALRRAGIAIRDYRRETGPRYIRKRKDSVGFTAEINARPAADALLALRDKKCAWPIGATDDPAFCFCSKEKVKNRPYCPEHMGTAYSRERG